MKRTLLATAALVLLPLAAIAAPGPTWQPGPYVSLGAGWNHLDGEDVDQTSLMGQTTHRFDGKVSMNDGFVGVGAAGYRVGNGIRAELELNYRWNQISKVSGSTHSGGTENKYGAMVNVYYDFDIGSKFVPYIGLGAGVTDIGIVNGSISAPNVYVTLQHPTVAFSYQIMAGVAYSLPIAGLDLTAEYRFNTLVGDNWIYGQYFAPGISRPANVKLSEGNNHALLLGLRYYF